MTNLMIPQISQEECAEVIQAISKVLRFGLHQCHPKTGKSNKESLEEEIGQLKYMLERLVVEYGLDMSNVWDAYYDKGDALEHWAAFYQTEPKAEV